MEILTQDLKIQMAKTAEPETVTYEVIILIVKKFEILNAMKDETEGILKFYRWNLSLEARLMRNV